MDKHKKRIKCSINTNQTKCNKSMTSWLVANSSLSKPAPSCHIHSKTEGVRASATNEFSSVRYPSLIYWQTWLLMLHTSLLLVFKAAKGQKRTFDIQPHKTAE